MTATTSCEPYALGISWLDTLKLSLLVVVSGISFYIGRTYPLRGPWSAVAQGLTIRPPATRLGSPSIPPGQGERQAQRMCPEQPESESLIRCHTGWTRQRWGRAAVGRPRLMPANMLICDESNTVSTSTEVVRSSKVSERARMTGSRWQNRTCFSCVMLSRVAITRIQGNQRIVDDQHPLGDDVVQDFGERFGGHSGIVSDEETYLAMRTKHA